MHDHKSLVQPLERVSLARQLFEKLLKGEKLALDPDNPQDKALIEMIGSVNSDVPAKFYYKTPTSLKDRFFSERQDKIDTSAHFLSTDLIEEARSVVSFLKTKGHENLEVAASNPRTRSLKNLDKSLVRADNFVLTPQTDFVGLVQALKLLELHIEEAMAGNAQSPLPKLFILNADGRFDSLLDFCGLDQNTMPQLPVFQSGSLDDFANILRSDGKDTAKPLPAQAPLVLLNAGDGPIPLSHATGNGEKINDLERIVRTLRYPFDLHHIDEAIGPSPENCELRGSFSSNAEAKHEEVAGAIAVAPSSVIEANLGIGNTRRALYVVSDGGIVFNDPRIADYFVNHPWFGAHLRTIVHPDIGFPGPESKPVMSAVGSKEIFFRMAVDACKQIKANGGTPDYSATEHTVFMMGFYDPEVQDNVSVAVRSTQPIQFLDNPSFDDEYDGDIGGRHYTKLPGEFLTLVQQDDRDDPIMSRETAFAKAFNGLVDVCGIAPGSLSLEFQKSARPDFQVQFDSQVIICGQSFGHAPIIQKLWDHNIQSTDWAGQINTIDDLLSFFLERPDVLVISGRPVSNLLPAERLLADWLIPCIAFVDSQTDPTACKPIFEKTEYTRPFLNTIRQMIQTGVIGERMCDVVDIAHTQDQLLEKILATAAMAKSRSFREEYPPNTVTLRDSHRPNISLLVSASSQNPKHLDSSYDLTRNFIDHDLGVVTGMGKKSAMGLSVYASLEATAAGQDVYVAGVQEPALAKREGFPIEYVEAFFGGVDVNNQANVIVEASRLERILKILEVDKILDYYSRTNQPMKKIHVGVGGAGTLEEILVALWLKMSGHPAFLDMHIVLLNHDKVFKPFIEHMNGGLGNNNVNVAESEAEVMQVIGRILKIPIAYKHYARPHGVGFYPFEASENPNLQALMAKAPSNTGNPSADIAGFDFPLRSLA